VETPSQLDPLERADLNHGRCLRLALSDGPERVGVSETVPVSETSCSLAFFRIQDDAQMPKNE
jgi:hypothetical protein